MDPTHPDFLRLADPPGDRNFGAWRLGLLLPLAAAVPLIVTVIRHRPEAQPVEVPEPVVSAYEMSPLPPLEAEAVSVVTEEEPAGPSDVVIPALRTESSPGTGIQGRLRGLRPKSHLVLAGETLTGVSQQYQCELRTLAATNGLDPEGRLIPGAILILPKPGVTEAPKVASLPKAREPVLTPVPANWTSPAQAALVAQAPEPAVEPVSAQVRSSNYPYVAPEPIPSRQGAGAENEPGPVQPVSGRTITGQAALAIHYLVQPGDGLESIAAAHFTSVSLVKQINKIGAVTPGQVILVPVDQCLSSSR